jgi:magnesium chelatase accessory protein
MTEPLNWDRDGQQWPHRRASRFVQAAGLRWHVQSLPLNKNTLTDEGLKTILLIHGTGAATHSWRDVMPPLAKKANVIAIDLPGHGFTEAPAKAGYSLDEMALALLGLLRVMQIKPDTVVGHSAGAAILARLIIDKKITPSHFVSVNGAMLPLTGLAGEVFSPIAKVISRSKFVPKLFAWRASDPTVLNRLLDGTGSTIDDKGRQLYGTLISNAGHAAAALNMMANWDLRPLERDLHKLTKRACRITLIVGENDKTVSPREAERVLAILAQHPQRTTKHIKLAGLGHLAHEESPQQIANLILE